MSLNNRWKPLLSRTDLQKTDKLIAIGASVLSETDVPFTQTIADRLGKEYIQFSDTGISNETIFRHISYANLNYTNAIIMPVYTYLVREELVDIENIMHIAMLWTTTDKNKRKKQIELFYNYIWNEQQASARFWNRLFDAKLATKQAGNFLINIWDSKFSYDIEIGVKLNKEKLPNMYTESFRDFCIDENAFRDFYLETLERSPVDYHMTQASHNKLAVRLLEGNTQ